MIYNNFWDLMFDLTKCIKDNESYAYSCDQPKQLLFCWGVPRIVGDDQYFMLRLSTVRNRKAFPFIDNTVNEVTYILENLIRTSSGRKEIADILTKYKNNYLFDLLRYLQLKCFW